MFHHQSATSDKKRFIFKTLTLKLRKEHGARCIHTWFDTLFSQENMVCAMLCAVCQNLVRIYSCHQCATHNGKKFLQTLAS